MKEFIENIEKPVNTRYGSNRMLIKHSKKSRKPDTIISYPQLLFYKNEKRTKTKFNKARLNDKYFDGIIERLKKNINNKA